MPAFAKKLKLQKRTFLRILAILTSMLLLGGWWLFHDLPSLDSINAGLHIPSIRITDRNGQLLYEIIPEEGGRHKPVGIDQLPEYLLQAAVATEDRSFYQNPGVDAFAILRALWINLRGGETLAGGSTITQQTARNLLLDDAERSQRTIRRKLRESYLAWQITRKFSKDEILLLYLNQIYFGGLSYGIEAAAQTYFGKPAAELDLAESALLAGLPQSPSIYNPFSNPKVAKQRQLIVLGLMEEAGFISALERQHAEAEPLFYSSVPYPIEAPHFVMMVQNQVDALAAAGEIDRFAGLTVRTTLDLNWQRHAEAAITQQLVDLRESGQEGLEHNVNNAALVALDPQNSQILALAGSADYFNAAISGAVNMATAPRQPGSALKPFIYAAVFDPQRDAPWTAGTMILDVSTTFQTADELPYTPKNFDKLVHGPVLVREALASSLNIPAVLALQEVGLENMIEFSASLGITTFGDPKRYDLSMALGGAEVSLLELSTVYAALANQGYYSQAHSILEIIDWQGDIVYRHPGNAPVQVLDEGVAWLLSDILSDNRARTIGFGPTSALMLDRPAAVKTGTTTNFHDNWTIGYTPDVVVGVWVGNANQEAMRNVTGLSGAAPIWHQFMRTVLIEQPETPFTRPPGLVQVDICLTSGMLPSQPCPYTGQEWFIVGTQPTQPDNFYQIVEIDSRTGLLADANTPPQYIVMQTVINLPPEAHPWARTQGLVLFSDLMGQSAANPGETESISLLSPQPNSVYVLSESVSGDLQRILLQAVTALSLEEVTFWVDGVPVATLDSAPYEAWWTLEVGIHEVWVQGLTLDGETITSNVVTFEVIQ
jgi:penicillin-binding protein 1C